MSLKIKPNDKCIVRHQDCKRIFGGSRICFVACPNSQEIALELEIIRQKLRDANIEPYIAVDQRDFQKDIFCEKICTKIIESQFCIVILNDVSDPKDNIRKPNANVYYEYGLMTAFRKRIIPVQFAGQSLAFNIQSLDTLKYQPRDFPSQIEEAIKMTLLNLESEQMEKEKPPHENNATWALDLMGLIRADDRFRFRYERVFSSRDLGFKPYQRPKDGRLFYVGFFDPEDNEKDIIIRAKMLTLRIKNYTDQLSKELEELRLASESRSRPTERIFEQERILKNFLECEILIVKPNILDHVHFQELYKTSAEDIGLNLDFEVLEDTLIKSVLCFDEG